MENTTTSTRRAAYIDAFGWGSLFVMTGLFMLVPGLPEGAWLVGFGTIIVIANIARVGFGLAAQWLGIIVGAGALLAGAGTIVGLDLPVLALVLIACGIAVIARPLTQRDVQA